ncbi:MAG: hypothetical protein ACRDSI_16845 [Pseudonocardiaceae bacterium]
MRFEGRFRAGIQDGTTTVTFRRWKRPQAVAGHRYRTTAGMIEVDAVDVVDESAITDAEARRGGYPHRAAMVADLRGAPDLPLYRVRFHHAGQDPRDALAAHDDLSDAEVAELDRRLDRLDRASAHGPWTAAVLSAIAERPAVRAAELAAAFGRDTQPFKIDVRKLKNLGLTISLDVGYRLSPRGEAYRRRTTHGGLA